MRYAGVHKLPPGHQLAFSYSGHFQIQQYWDRDFPASDDVDTRTVDEMIQGVRERLLASVRLRLRSDVPLAVCLSGGIDSASVAGIAAALVKEKDPDAKIATFTLSFPGAY